MSEITMENGVVIDRSRLSHRDSKKAIVLQSRVNIANESGDVDLLAQLLDEIDHFMEKIVVSVPPEFYTPDVSEDVMCPAAGWMDHLRQDKYEELMLMMQRKQHGAEGN